MLNVSDYTLMVSYVMSLQYYAIFWCAGPDTDGHPLDLAMDSHQEECRRRVWDTARIHAYTNSIDQILTPTLGEDTHPDLSRVGREIIEKAANSPWIGKILSGEDHSSIVDQAAWSAEPDFVDRLKIWFAYKLQGEQQRHTAGHHLEEDDEVFCLSRCRRQTGLWKLSCACALTAQMLTISTLKVSKPQHNAV